MWEVLTVKGLSLTFATLDLPSRLTTLSLIPKELSYFSLLPAFKMAVVPSDRQNLAHPSGTMSLQIYILTPVDYLAPSKIIE